MTVGKPDETGVLAQNSTQNPPEIGQKTSAPKILSSDAFRLDGWVIEEEKDLSKTPVFDANSDGPVEARAKSSLRMRYEAEVQLIKRKLGPLEFIRGQLGLTQRKMCQLLLVDPSAWTRWTREGEDAPPHIYRSLQWYLAIQDKYPALDVNFWLSTVVRTDESRSNQARDQQIEDLRLEIKRLNGETLRLTTELRETTQSRRRSTRLKMRLAVIAALIGGLIAGLLVSRLAWT